MIQNGDKFSAPDLLRSVDELRTRQTSQYMLDHDRLHVLCDTNGAVHAITAMTPDTYADIQTTAYNTESSAASLDDQLRRSGYKTTYRFAHKYHIPGIDKARIIQDAYRLEYFYTCFIARLEHNIRLSDPRAFLRDCDDAARVSYYYAQYIWATNPCTRFDYAQRLDLYQDWGLVLRFLLGTGFGFAPRDVYHFVTTHSYHGDDFDGAHAKSTREQLKFKNWCMDKYGIDTGCLVLHPDTMTKLRKILTNTDRPYAIQLALKYLKMLRPGPVR